MNIYEFVSLPAALAADREAVVFGPRRYDYQQLRRSVLRLATGLAERGVGPGSRVGAFDTNSDRYLIAMYAAAFLGATFFPLNNRAKGAELEHLLTAADPGLLFLGEQYSDLIAASLAGRGRGRGPALVSFGAGSAAAVSYADVCGPADVDEEADPADVDDESVAIVMFTAGTTSTPKAVPLRHAALTSYVMESSDPAGDDDHYAQVLVAPFYHVAGLTSTMLSPYAGRRMIILPQFDSRAWLDTVQAERATHAFMVPTMVKRLIEDDRFGQYDLSSLETLTYGAAAMPPGTLLQAIERFPPTVGFVNSYGQTETTATVTMLGPEDHRLVGTPEQIEVKKRRLRSIGKPLADVELRIVREDHQPVTAGAVGELAIRTSRAMKGYLTSEPAADQSGSDPQDWLYTADLAWMDDDGYIFLAGRRSEMIIRGGENISPAEVEAALYQHPAVDDVAVIGVPDEEWGERVVAYVVLRDGIETAPTEAELIDFCRTRMASFKKPAEIYLVTELPRSSIGKLLKRNLQEAYGQKESAR